ncbi:MAG: hypothetical protein IBJ03_07420 [Gemmatimonadaceae bacterium]|nr:hypothetical protein [Gemmatimonadaceae bacterium]
MSSRCASQTISRTVLLRSALGILLASQMLVSQVAAAQSTPVPEVEAAKPNATLSGFDQVRNVRELGDGRLLLVDGARLVVADLATKKSEERSLLLDGPEVRALVGLWRWVDDSLVTLDPVAGRMLVLDKTGAMARVVPIRGSVRSNVRAVVSPELAFGTLIQQRPPMAPNSATPPPRMPVPVVRLRLASASFDTAVQIMPAPAPRAPLMNPGGAYTVYASPVGILPVDAWAPLSDGTIMVLRAASYRVDLVGTDGTRASVGPVPYNAVPVTDDDRKRIMDDMRRSTELALRNNPRRTSISTINIEEPKTWPATHPPFRSDATPVVDPIDRVWLSVRCEKSARDTCFDVIDRDGQRLSRVRFPGRTAIVGFGAVSIYTVDLQKPDKPVIQRHALPSL